MAGVGEYPPEPAPFPEDAGLAPASPGDMSGQYALEAGWLGGVVSGYDVPVDVGFDWLYGNNSGYDMPSDPHAGERDQER